MKLTPLDIQHKEFRRALRGYNEEDVDSFLDEVVKEFERIFNENIELKERIEKAEEKLKQYEGLEQTLQKTLLTAQQAAEDIQNNAKKEAELIIKEAEVKAKELVQHVASDKQVLEMQALALKEAERSFIDKFGELLNSFKEMLDKVKSGKKPSDVFSGIKLPEPEKVEPAKELSVQKETPASSSQADLEKTQAISASDLGFAEQPKPSTPTGSQEAAESQKVATQATEATKGEEQTIKVTLGTATKTTTAERQETEKVSESVPPKKPKAVEIAEKMSSFFDDDIGVDEKEPKKPNDSNIEEIS